VGSRLVRLATQHKLTEDLVRRLLDADLDRWKELLVKEGLLHEEDDDPIPRLLPKYVERIKSWRPLVDVLRDDLPKRASSERLKSARQKFNLACRGIYRDWLNCSNWQSPLLVLDEAHHAKNDDTHLARLFRQSSSEDVALLAGKFQRMLFLTATPFQLGHQELIRVLQSFGRCVGVAQLRRLAGWRNSRPTSSGSNRPSTTTGEPDGFSIGSGARFGWKPSATRMSRRGGNAWRQTRRMNGRNAWWRRFANAARRANQHRICCVRG